MDVNINSSDYEDLGEHEPDRSMFARDPNIGKRVSMAILENQAIDRPLSKKNARELVFAHGAPSTRRAQQSVMNIWDSFCQSINHDIKSCPSGEQIFRFVDTRARRTTPVISGKLKPSLSVMKGIWRHLIDLLIFRHKDLTQHYNGYDVKRIAANLDQLALQGLLIRGRWRKRQWIGFKVIQRMAQVWLDRNLSEGCLSWDRVMLKLLGVLLQASCSARSGDVARSNYYEGLECLCWKHLELKIHDRGQELETVQNLTLAIALEFTKGHKLERNDSKDIVVNPMEGESLHCVCLIKVLLIVAIRFGRVAQTSVEEVLARAAERYDGVVEWLTPDAPVLCQMPRGTSAVSYDKPAHQSQILHSIRGMALAAGLIAPITTGDIRNGSLRDAAHLQKPISGVADLSTALVAGHTSSAFGRGLTQKYVGSLQEPIWNMRAADPFEDRLAPKFGPTPFTKASNFKPRQIDEYMDKHGLDKSDLSHRFKAGRDLKKVVADEWREEQKKALAGPAPKRKKAEKPAQPLRQRDASEMNADAGRTTKAAGKDSTANTRHTPEYAGVIDPRLLLLDDVETAEVDDRDLNHICDLVGGAASGDSPTEPEKLDDHQEADDEAIAEALTMEAPLMDDESGEALAQSSLLQGNAFVAKFASINIYRLKRSFDSSDPEVVARYVPTGNSRDVPQPFLYHCSKCEYTSRWPQVVEAHDVTCAGAPADEPIARYYCHYDDCSKSYPKEQTLKSHINTVHEFTPRACVRCTDKPDMLFNTFLALQKHKKQEHDKLDSPIVCPYKDDCGKKAEFTTKASFKAHLKQAHKKTLEEVAVLVPRKKSVRAKKSKQPETDDADDDDSDEGQVRGGGRGGRLSKRSRID